jgi:hypothetical protein
MTYSSLVTDRALKKIILARLNPLRDISFLMTALGGGEYSYSLFHPVESIYRNVTGFTRMAVGAALSNDQYWHDESTGEIRLKSGTAPSSSYIFTVSYYLFVSNSINVFAMESLSSGAERYWEPRIISISPVSADQENSLVGIVTISSGSVTLADTDDYIKSTLTVDDSYRERQIKVWEAINTPSDYKLIYSGRIISVSYDEASITFNYDDETSRMKGQATMGDSPSDIYINSNNYPELYEQDIGKIIPFIFGSQSALQVAYATQGIVTNKNDPTNQSLWVYYPRFPIEMLGNTATCIDYYKWPDGVTPDGTKNRDFLACRVSSSGLYDFSNTITSITIDYAGDTGVEVVVNTWKDYKIGMSFEIGPFNAGTTTRWASIYQIDSANKRLFMFVSNLGYFTVNVIYNNPCPVVYAIAPGSPPFLPDYYLYTRSIINSSRTTYLTTGGNRMIRITLPSTTQPDFDPATWKLYYQVFPIENNHADVAKYISTKAGMELDTTSFTTAKSELDLNVSFQIPYFEDDEILSYNEYIQAIIKSTMGIFGQVDDKVYYQLLNAISPTVAISPSNILDGGVKVNVDYQDTLGEIVAYNRHLIRTDTYPQKQYSVSSARAKYLHGILSSVTMEIVAEDVAAAIARILSFRKERVSSYSLSTIAINEESTIGDNYILEDDMLPNGQINGKIISITKEQNRTQVKLIDIPGV